MSSSGVFQQLWNDVIRPGLCSGCGTCMAMTDNHFNPKELSSSFPWASGSPPARMLSLLLPPEAWEACPGKGMNYPELNRFFFESFPENWLIGHIRKSYIGYATDENVRRKAASGGVISRITMYLLEQRLVDGVITIRQNPEKSLEVEPVLITDPTEILSCSQSIYFPVPVNSILCGLETGKKYAFVGLPDQVASLRKLQLMGWKPATQIDYVVGPYMGINMDFAGIISFLHSNGVKNLSDVATLKFREGEWPGYLKVTTHTRKVITARKFYYNYLLPFYTTRHSLLTPDFTNELTDISVGDAWSPVYEKEGKGFSVVLARTTKGLDLLEKMSQQSAVTPKSPEGDLPKPETRNMIASAPPRNFDSKLEPNVQQHRHCEERSDEATVTSNQKLIPLHLQEISLSQALDMHGHMIDFKKRGSFIRIYWRNRMGRPAPDWGYMPESMSFMRYVVEVAISGIFAIGRWPLARWLVGRIPVSIIGPVFDVLRKSWKNISKPTKRKKLKETKFIIN